jgi:hypothetical protein
MESFMSIAHHAFRSFLGTVAVVGCISACAWSASYTDYYPPSWFGGGGGDTVVSNGSGCAPVTPSNCPNDPDMANTQHYTDLLFDGQSLIKQTANASTVGDAIAIDWTHNLGWITGLIAGNLHWTALNVPVSDANLKFVFWVKGAAGGEEKLFQFAFKFTNDSLSAYVKAPTIPAITTSWKKVVIPMSVFFTGKTVNTTGVKSLQINPIAKGSMILYFDNMYFTTRIVGVEIPFAQRSIQTNRQTVLRVIGNLDALPTAGVSHTIDIFSLNGRDITRKITGANTISSSINQAYIIRLNKE